jgi:hypothetical protein
MPGMHSRLSDGNSGLVTALDGPLRRTDRMATLRGGRRLEPAVDDQGRDPMPLVAVSRTS